MKRKIFTWTIAALLMVVIGGLVFVYFNPDYTVTTVRSGSMTGTFNTGDVIITVPVNSIFKNGVRVGDVVIYQHNSDMITHRVIGIDGDRLQTKGDAVEHQDPWQVSLSEVKGAYLFKVPNLGFLLTFMGTKRGWFIAIIIPALVLVGWIIKDILKETFSDATD
jgi:signal peptidase I